MTSQITPPPFALRTLGALDLTGPGGRLRAVLAQPKRLALLAHLACGGARRRDELLPLFWPDLDDARARTALRQALRFLRASLAPDVVAGEGDVLEVRPDLLGVDTARFAELVAAERWADALDLHAGDFLAGFFVAGADAALERWMESERRRLRELAGGAAARLVALMREAREHRAAVHWARRGVAFDPLDEAAHRRLIEALADAGDRAGALQAYDALAQRLAHDLELEPSEETRRLVARVRSAARAVQSPTPIVAATSALASPPSRGSVVVAVEPFAYAGPEEDAYLAGGLADAVRDALRAVPGLDVRSRLESSDGPDALRQSGVQVALGGSVERADGALRVRARLVDLRSGDELWSDAFEREPAALHAIEERLARAIVAALRITLAAGRTRPLVRRPSSVPEAYNLYLRGRHHWNRRPRETLKGLAYFERAVAIDPTFALAHAGIADAYNTLGAWEASVLPSWEAFPRAHAAAQAALALDPGLAEGLTSLAYARMHYLWRYDDADAEFARAVSLDAGYAHAHHWRAHLLLATGRIAEALDAGRAALRLDPLDLVINVHMAWHHWMAREPDEAAEQCRRTAELEPRDQWSPFFLGLARLQQGRIADALAAHREAYPRSGESPVMLGALAHTLACAGERREAANALRELTRLADERHALAYEVALVHAASGDADQAFDWLDRAYEERSSWMAYLAVEPRLDILRADGRFTSLLRAVKLLPPPAHEHHHHAEAAGP